MAPEAADLLAWYDTHRRDLPWRAKPGERSDPYAVWLSEIMLQQTTVAAVRPYYARFLALWPDVRSLAAAPLDDVLKAWAGLGYYSRARNLHACALAVVDRHAGTFPGDEAALRTLPGVGAYTAAAVSAIAFGLRAVVVDGNVERVMARLGAVERPLPAARRLLRAAMDRVTPAARAGDFAQAVMDLGATICTPRSPACVICPVGEHCAARHAGNPGDYPRKAPKKAVPHRRGAVFFIEDDRGYVLVRTRPAQGLFGGMTEFPGTLWTEEYSGLIKDDLPMDLVGPLSAVGTVANGLTHFSLSLDVFRGRAKASAEGHRWIAPESLDAEALPTLMRKVLERVRQERSGVENRPGEQDSPQA